MIQPVFQALPYADSAFRTVVCGFLSPIVEVLAEIVAYSDNQSSINNTYSRIHTVATIMSGLPQS